MYRILLGLIGFFATAASAQNVNTTAQVNKILETKNKVGYQTIVFKGTDPFSGVPRVGTRHYTGPAEATSVEVIEASNITFETAKLAKLPEIALMTQKSLRNCGDANLSSSIALSVTGTRSWSVTKTRSISTTNSISLTGSLSVPNIGSRSTSMSWQNTVGSSASKTEGGQESISRSMTDTISIGPKKAILVSLVAYQNSIAVPFHAVVVIDGPLRVNTSGKTRVSDLLTTDERTFPIDGILTITDVSEADVRTSDLSKDQGCTESNNSLAVENTGQLNIHTADLSSQTAPIGLNYSRESSLLNYKNTSHPIANSTIDNNNEPTIGSANGTSYQILFTEERSVPTPACGFNDIGAMNVGIFTVEHREYTTYVDGKEVARWHEEFEVFKECYSP